MRKMGARQRILLDAINTARQFGTKYAKSTIDIDYKLLKHAGWKPGAARGISHGIFAGSIANYIKDDQPGNDGGSISKINGSKANKPNQTRSRFKRNSSRRYRSNKCNCAKHRYTNSSRY